MVQELCGAQLSEVLTVVTAEGAAQGIVPRAR